MCEPAMLLLSHTRAWQPQETAAAVRAAHDGIHLMAFRVVLCWAARLL